MAVVAVLESAKDSCLLPTLQDLKDVVAPAMPFSE
jgi:hypothetical protein